MTASGSSDPSGPVGPVDRDMLLRHVIGRATVSESLAVAAWLAADAAHARELDLLRTVWDAVGAPPTEPADDQAEWARLRTKLTAEMGAPSSIPRHPAQSVSRATRRPAGALPNSWPRGVEGRSTWRVAAVAVVLVLAVGFSVAIRAIRRGAGIASASAGREYATAAGQRLSVTLVDGTQVTLAPGSAIRVAADYGRSRKSREVEVEGEAYFVVAHDVLHPFAVRTRDAMARDVGTAFDVRAYPEDAGARIAVAEGAVAVSTARACHPSLLATGGGCGAQIRPGDVATVGGDGVAIEHGVDVASLTGWTRGELTFRDTRLRDVAAELSRWYDLEVRVSDPTLGSREVTGKFASDSLTEGLSFLGLALEAQVERHGRVVTFMRRTH